MSKGNDNMKKILICCGIALGAFVLIISILKILKTIKSEKRYIQQESPHAQVENDMKWCEPETMAIEDIWKIEEQENFVYQMWLYILDNCDEFGDLHNLNAEQRVFYVVQDLQNEVNNGGFAQYFYNDSGDFANEAVSAFESIGAYELANVCKKAIGIYGDKVPTDRDERENVLISDDEKEEERIEEILKECDDTFFEYEDNLVELIYQFIINNKESFLK